MNKVYAKKYKKTQSKNLTIKLSIIIAIVFFALFALLISPLFQIRQIDIVGNDIISEADVLSSAGLSLGINIFSVSPNSIAHNISSMVYIRNANVVRHFPGLLTISLEERIPIAALRLNNLSTYIIIDDLGMVLSSSTALPYSLPVVTGIELTGFAVGNYLEIENNAVFGSIVFLSRILRRHDVPSLFIDFSDIQDIVIHTENLEVFFGNTNNADRRAQQLAAIIEQIPRYGRGFIHIRDTDISPRFVPLR